MGEYIQKIGRDDPDGPGIGSGAARHLFDAVGLDTLALEEELLRLEPEVAGQVLRQLLEACGVIIKEDDNLQTIAAKCTRAEIRAGRRKGQLEAGSILRAIIDEKENGSEQLETDSI